MGIVYFEKAEIILFIPITERLSPSDGIFNLTELQQTNFASKRVSIRFFDMGLYHKGNMPRQPRLGTPGLLQHVMARGIERRKIFKVMRRLMTD